MKIELSYQRQRNVFVLDLQHGSRDVTCKPATTLKPLDTFFLKIDILEINGLFKTFEFQDY